MSAAIFSISVILLFIIECSYFCLTTKQKTRDVYKEFIISSGSVLLLVIIVKGGKVLRLGILIPHIVRKTKCDIKTNLCRYRHSALLGLSATLKYSYRFVELFFPLVHSDRQHVNQVEGFEAIYWCDIYFFVGVSRRFCFFSHFAIMDCFYIFNVQFA